MPLKRVVWEQEDLLYGPLLKLFGDGRVFPKVRMADVIALEDWRLIQFERDYMLMAHFDFVAVKENSEPIAAYEIDGSYHDTDAKTIKRDKLKDSICKKVGLPLIRIPLDEIKKAWYSVETDHVINWYRNDNQSIGEVIRDLALAEYEARRNPEFGEFLEWYANDFEHDTIQSNGRAIVLAGRVEYLVHLVSKLGLEKAKRFLVNEIESWRIADSITAGLRPTSAWNAKDVPFLDDAREALGVSREAWDKYGASAELHGRAYFRLLHSLEEGIEIELPDWADMLSDISSSYVITDSARLDAQHRVHILDDELGIAGKVLSLAMRIPDSGPWKNRLVGLLRSLADDVESGSLERLAIKETRTSFLMDFHEDVLTHSLTNHKKWASRLEDEQWLALFAADLNESALQDGDDTSNE